MKARQYLALGLLVALPLAASAQNTAQGASHQRSPLDASTTASGPAYVSAFRNYQVASDEETTPDKVWRNANDAVGKLGGHAGHIQGNADTAPATQPKSAAKDARALSQTTPMTTQHGHHHHQ
ncbi:hypothetical protein [Paucimonas lemoignei]|uniref:hypothetical protein n=1 Tax=Paucimonas lemoignei TaxID=29443 RepID=UPI0010484BBF|nr:hypothetical protein [Paucimonas lemoignei]